MSDKDTVYRQAAIDAINSYFGFNIEEEYGSAVQEVINGLPSVQPERKKGKWIGEPKDGIEAMFFKPKCSVCGFESAEVKNYCPNCGSFNGGKDEQRT